MRVVFGDYLLDTATFELRRGGEHISLEPQVFDVLRYLIEHRDRVISKEELLDNVWGDRFVSESALTSRIRDARRAIGDDGQAQRCIQTLHGRGYRFIADVTDLAPASAPTHNLPADRTPLIGRERDIEDLVDLAGRHRLISLLGIGGSGKTRLAVATARRLLDEHPDGVWLVDLVAAADDRSVDTAIAEAVGLALAAGDTLPQLARMLDGRRLLVVLDNCEHVGDAVAATLDHLLEHTTSPRFLATTREPLDLPDECRVHVAPLPSQASGDSEPGPAVALFLAAAERFSAPVPPSELPVVRRICERLDGLPLALELAAAQLRLLSPDEVAERLDRPFELLQDHRRSVPDRHASLMAVLDGTWHLLDPGEQTLLGRLAVFPGPFSVADAEDLCADLAVRPLTAMLTQLVDRSLVVPAASARSFRLLETVRLFALERTDHARHAAAHAAWCVRNVGASMAQHLFDFDIAVWCTRHFDDLRAAEQHLLLQGRPAEAAHLTTGTSLAMHCDAGSRAAEMLERVDGHLQRTDDPALRCRLHVTGVLAGMAARSPAAMADHGSGALADAEASGDAALLSVALAVASWSVVFDDPDRALQMVERASALATDAGDVHARDHADSYRAFHLAMQRRYEEAIAQATTVVERARGGTGSGQASFVSVVALGSLQFVEAPEEARAWVPDLLSLPSPESIMWGSEVLAAAILASAGDVAEAVRLTLRVRGRLARAGQDSLPDLLVPAAALALRGDEPELAARWLRAIRDAGRPTQSFQMTCAYRRLREMAGLSEENPLLHASLEEIGDEAIEWMRAQADGTVGSTAATS